VVDVLAVLVEAAVVELLASVSSFEPAVVPHASVRAREAIAARGSMDGIVPQADGAEELCPHRSTAPLESTPR